MRAILVQNMREKYAEFGEICPKICCIYAEICGVNHAYGCVYVGQNAQKCWKMRSHMRKYANFCKFMHKYIYSKCINKYSKFWKCHYMRENMRYVHFCEICCDRMFAINRYPYSICLCVCVQPVLISEDNVCVSVCLSMYFSVCLRVQPVLISEDDVQKQEQKVREARRRLQQALVMSSTSSDTYTA